MWKESLVNYNFNREINGTELIKNLNWLGRTNELMDKAPCMMTAGELDSGEDESDDIVGFNVIGYLQQRKRSEIIYMTEKCM